MYYTTNKATALYSLPNATDVASILAASATQLPQGTEAESANPPQTVLGYVQVTANGLTGYVAQSDLTQETLSKTQKLGVGIAAVVLGWLFFFKKH